MALNTFVYIRDVENLSDARYCAAMGVEMIGFRLDSNLDNSLDILTFKEISNWISGVKIVGEFGHMPIDQIKEILNDCKVDYLLVPEIELLEQYSGLNKQLILQLDLNAKIEDQLSALNFSTEEFDFLLLTSSKSELDADYKSIIQDLANEYPVILGFGIDDHNANKVVSEFGLEGISLAGSSEIRPGFKDYDELANILETLEID